MGIEPNASEDTKIDSQATDNTSCTNNSLAQDTNIKLGELISQLPDEVLAEIFSWCCPTFTDRFCAPPMSALVLSHVCARWRRTAFSTPKLWTYTSLGASRHHCESATELMLLWLDNSKTCPVVIDIDFCQFAAFKTPDAILPTVLELAELANEKKKKKSRPEDMNLSVSVQPSVTISFPYVLEEYYWTNDEEDDLPRDLAPNSMQLRVATKPCVLLGMEGHRDFGPYLVHLDLRDEEEAICLTMEEALDIIRVYPNLRHLAFRLGYAGEGEQDCMLPKLKTLAVSWNEDTDPALFFNSLTAPMLRNLELDGKIPAFFVGGPRWLPLRQFLVRSTPPLRALDLYKIRCDDVDLLGCLGRCATLERLWLQECTIEKRLVEDFTGERHPLAEPAQGTLQNLKILGLVKCICYNARHYFETLIASGLVWRITTLEGLYLSDCNIHEGVLETWHLLRSRYEDGAYKDLA